jgi:hypothetical protein
LVDDNAAQREAERIAAALQRSRGHVWSVLVTNQWGHHVTQIPEPLRAKGSRDGPPLPAALKGVVFRLDLDVPEVVTSRITARDSRP